MTVRCLTWSVAILLLAAPLLADEAPSEPPSIPLWPDLKAPERLAPEKVDQRNRDGEPSFRFITGTTVPTLTVYLPPAEKNTGAAVIICPGGGYSGVAIDHEGHDVARMLNKAGVAGIVLKYRMPHPEITHGDTPWPLQDAQRTIRLVRSKAAEWHVDPKKVGIMGFSAGGHLAATAATHVVDGSASAADPLERFSTRPDFAVLIYPVITLHDPIAHTGSRNNLLGKEADSKLVDLYSADQQVTAGAPPTFLVHAEDDPVKCENSLRYFMACRANKVPAELRLYVKGGHGFGMGKAGSEVSTWPQHLVEWMAKQQIAVAPVNGGRAALP
jgi:acetyl esterase/lipase